MNHSTRHLLETADIARQIDPAAVERCVATLLAVRERGGRLFVLGVGGSAANASHAAADLRRLAGFEAYAPTDNIAGLTAAVNDDGWPEVFARWLQESRLRRADGLLVFSVGGGSREAGVSVNVVEALGLARTTGAAIVGVVGRDGGHTAQVADACVVVPTVNPHAITPHTEAFQAVIWHLFVTHPALRTATPRWESLAPGA